MVGVLSALWLVPLAGAVVAILVPPTWRQLANWVGLAVAVAVLALAIAIPGLGAHSNESFAAARITGYKNFLRMHVDAAGALTVYAIGIDRAVKRRHWRAVPEAEDPEAAWITPVRGEPRARLIDRITIQ